MEEVGVDSVFEKLDLDEVRHAVAKARCCEDRLLDLRKTLEEATHQVKRSAEKSAKDVEVAFDELMQSFIRTTATRKEKLLQDIARVRDDAFLKLSDCRNSLEIKLETTREIVDMGQKVLHNRAEMQSSLALKTFFDSSSLISSYSAHPKLTDVPWISVSFDRHLLHEPLFNALLSYGSISSVGPYQITESEEKPGAVAICWEEREGDNFSEPDPLRFQLQVCLGNVLDDISLQDNFGNVYEGPETCCIVRALKPETDYSFRVCRSGSKRGRNSGWSQPYVTRTTLPCYEWDSSNTSYRLFDERRAAVKETRGGSSLLLSVRPQFQCRHSLQFRCLEVDEGCQEDEGVGLSMFGSDRYPKNDKSGPICPGAILVNVAGHVFVDGIRMTTQLPKLLRGSVLTFESEEELPNARMRVMITCEGKQVTYDWKLSHLGSSDPVRPLSVYFFAHFRKEGSKIRVE